MYLEISNPMDYHAALYIRLSKEDESEGPSQSVQNQESLLREFVQEHRLTVFDTYVDDGWSGTNFDRPSFQRMIADIEAKKVNMVITKDLSRLGRDYIMTGHYMERYFPEHRVRYISLLDGIDTGVDSTANDITPFRAIMNDMYAKDISKKIKSVKRDKQRKGEFIGGKPVYGYKMHPTEKNKIVIDEEVAPIVRRIFALALGGMSCRNIAVLLNREGIPTPATYANLPVAKPGPYTGLWSSERISEMLQNETYIGNMVQGRSVKISYKSKKCLKQDPANWVVVEGTHEPLVDAESFRRVRMLLNSRKHTRSRTYDFLLKGLIFCHECGYPLAVINRKNTRGEDVLYFVCRTYQRFTKAGVCTCHSIKEKTVTDAVIARVQEVCRGFLNPEELLPMAREAVEEARKQNSLEAELQALQSRIDGLTASMDRVYADRLSGLLPEEDFQRLFNRLKLDRKLLEERRQEMELQKKSPVTVDDRARELVERFIQTAGESRELLVSLIERVELTEDKEIIIKFRFAQLDEVAQSQQPQGLAPSETAPFFTGECLH
ncbi:resolvase, N-terminal domain protein [Pseudoflavonifractor capillosus ATCC 29799]|uniref:Resolvase, N-terminal domain protein n=1 Tax=Pseudoflavonifractor capillosus ATCC 29799 TaxID=411467 RepID=A6P1I2_9FIRM|nr:recombinase family protein [Pseudoflavonifractor capillosus]EDM97874.1 resolvase, N-terminal domain protein [Pseudoflavonifractor capillosus ATCC 29799]